MSNPYRYSGYVYDSETNLYYLNARFYSAETARFLQEDSYRGNIGDPLSLNLYAYVCYNPLIYRDPTGHWQTGDELLPQEARDKIAGYTDMYFRYYEIYYNSTSTESEKILAKQKMDYAHLQAERVREEYAGQSSSSNVTSTGQAATTAIANSTNGYLYPDTWSDATNVNNGTTDSPKDTNDVSSNDDPTVTVTVTTSKTVTVDEYGGSRASDHIISHKSTLKFNFDNITEKDLKDEDTMKTIIGMAITSAMADGPLPYGDIIGIMILVGGTAIFNDKVSVSGLKDTPIDGLIDALITYVFDSVASFVSSIDLEANFKYLFNIETETTENEKSSDNKDNTMPETRKELDDALKEKGYVCKGQTPGGYVEYAHPDGSKVWVRPDGEVITVKREWLPDKSRKVDVRYQWDGTPVPNSGHNTGEFVEPIEGGTYVPPYKNIP